MVCERMYIILNGHTFQLYLTTLATNRIQGVINLTYVCVKEY